MKKLGSNFTTQEQSKQLLELGVPEWTADCCFSKSKDSEFICEGVKHIIPDYFCVQSVPFPAYPCWSVGRLIEILEITLGTPWLDHEELGKSTLLERVVRDFEYVVKYKEIFKDNRIDFSKLEE